MKFITLFGCVFLVVAFVGQTNAQRARKAVEPRRYYHGRPHGRPHRRPCGSNDLGDYKGGCDISVPVIVMPKGRPIMERVLEWFNCGTEICRPSEITPPTITTSTAPEEPPEDPPTSYPDEPETSPPSYPEMPETSPPEGPPTSPPSYTSMEPTENPDWN